MRQEVRVESECRAPLDRHRGWQHVLRVLLFNRIRIAAPRRTHAGGRQPISGVDSKFELSRFVVGNVSSSFFTVSHYVSDVGLVGTDALAYDCDEIETHIRSPSVGIVKKAKGVDNLRNFSPNPETRELMNFRVAANIINIRPTSNYENIKISKYKCLMRNSAYRSTLCTTSI